MVGQFGDEYQIVIERSQNAVSAQFTLFLRSIKELLCETRKRIPKSEIHLMRYADFIESKIFTGIPESNLFRFSSKKQIKTLIEGRELSENEKKLYASAMKLSLLESKNIKTLQINTNVSDTLDSINSLDGVLSSRLRRINSSQKVLKNKYIILGPNSLDDEYLSYTSQKKNSGNLLRENIIISYQNNVKHNVPEYSYDKN